MYKKTLNFDDFITEKHHDNEDAVDTITMDVPLFIRMLEFAKEDAKTDMDLHKATEIALKISKKEGKLSMDNYYKIVSECGQEEGKEEDDKDDNKDDKKEEKKDKKDKDDKKDKKDK